MTCYEGKEEEKTHVCSSPATNGVNESSEGNSERVAAPPAHVRKVGWETCGFQHVAEEWTTCSALPLLLLCFSRK